MSVEMRDLCAKAIRYSTKSNISELAADYTAGDKINARDLAFDRFFGYEMNEQANYIASPDDVYELSMGENWHVTSSTAFHFDGSEIYTTYGNDPADYKKAGFSAMPDLYYTLATDGSCYLHQRKLGYPCECGPTALSMAMMLSGAEDFDYMDFFNCLSERGFDLKKIGSPLFQVMDALTQYTDLSSCAFYSAYNPYYFLDDILNGHPVVIDIDNGIYYKPNSKFIRPNPSANTGYHAILLTGFLSVIIGWDLRSMTLTHPLQIPEDKERWYGRKICGRFARALKTKVLSRQYHLAGKKTKMFQHLAH